MTQCTHIYICVLQYNMHLLYVGSHMIDADISLNVRDNQLQSEL